MSGYNFEKYSNVSFMQIRPVRGEFSQADRGSDRRTDVVELIDQIHHAASACLLAKHGG